MYTLYILQASVGAPTWNIMTPNRMELEVNAKNELNYMVNDAETKTQCFFWRSMLKMNGAGGQC